MHKVMACESCEAEFTIRHDMDDDRYRLEYCPFCGYELDGVEQYELDEDEE